MKNLYAKLLAIQKEVKVLKKESVAKGNKFDYNYFNINDLLAELRPILNSHGLVVLQPLTNVEGKPAIETLVIDEASGDQIKSVAVIPFCDDPQDMGKVITYFRRYSLQSFFLLEAEDNDGSVKPRIESGRTEAPKTVYAPSNSKPASIKQKNFILSLAEAKGEEMSMSDLDNMTSAQASKEIDRLSAITSRVDDDTQFGGEDY